MIKIIKRGKIKKVKCKVCDTVLEYEKNDVYTMTKERTTDVVGMDYTYSYTQDCIKCPVCNEEIRILNN